MSAVVSVIGTILIILLKILLVLFLLLCFLLVCPICYKGTVDYHGKIMAEGRLLWLCGLFRVSFAYQDGRFGSRILLFGIDVQRVMEGHAKKKSKKASKGKRHQRNQPEQEHQEEREPALQQEIAQKEEKESIRDTVAIEKNAGEELIMDVVPKQGNEFSGEDFTDEKESFWHRLPFWHLKKRIFDFFQAMRQFVVSIRSICGKIRRKVEWAGEAKIFWYSENTQRMICILKDNVLHLWRKLKPKVLRGNIVFGTGDPCLTGQILGVAAVLYASCGRGMQITPDFEEKRLEGNLLVKGRISLITIGIILIRIFLRGEWSRFRREAERLKEAL